MGRGALKSAYLMRNARVPDGVEVVVARLVPAYSDIVAAARQVFHMEGLVNVADEVQDELQSFLAKSWVRTWVYEGRGLLVDCRDDAAFLIFAAVRRIAYAAFFRRRV
jgi:hypothetical protein